MKRDTAGKFVSNWDAETKQRFTLSLTSTAWQLLHEEARQQGISRSEVIERLARKFEGEDFGEEDSPPISRGNGFASSGAVLAEPSCSEAVMREAKQNVAHILESISDAFVAFDRDWRYTYVNRAAAQILGKSPADLIGKNVWQEVFSSEAGGVADQELHRSVAEQVPVSWEEFGQPVQRWLEVNAYPFADGVAVYFRDITERKQAEAERERLLQELKMERARFEAVLRQMPAGVMIAEAGSSKLVLTNDQAKELVGYDYEPSLGIEDYESVIPFTAFQTNGQPYAPNEYPLARSLQTGEIITNEEMELHWHDGRRTFLNVNSAPILNPDQQIMAAVVVFQDVSDRQQLEAELYRREQQFKTLTENAPDIIARFDQNLRHVYVSPAIEAASGLPAAAYTGKTHAELGVPEKICRLWQRQMQACFATGVGCWFDFDFPTPSGTRYYQTRMVPELSAAGSVESLLAITRDVTDYKQVEQTQRFLAQASQTFAAANLELQPILDKITRLVNEYTGDLCVVSLLSEDKQRLNYASFYHQDPAISELVGQLLENNPRPADEGVGKRVIQTGEPLLMTVTSQEELSAVMRPAYRAYLEHFRVSSLLIVPLKVRGTIMGALSLTRRHPAEPHNHQELALFQDLADRAAMAIANARLYQQATQARQQAEQTADRNARLQLVTAALSESLTPAQVAEVIVEQSKAVLNATAATVAVLNEKRGELEIVHSMGYSQDLPPECQRFPITAPTALAEAVRTETLIWQESAQSQTARYPHPAEFYTQFNYSAWICLPLIIEGRAVGGMSLSFTEETSLSKDERAFMLVLAQQCAQAIARAQLYEAEQQARAEAEAANRMKDEFLAVLSHELRTPMNPILGWTQLLREGRLDDSRAAIALETIERNARLQVQLIEDLLDVSRILSGKLNLALCPVDLVAIIQAAIRTVGLAAEAKALQIQPNFDSNPSLVLGDSARLQQVIWNLLSNAVKFTPKGGQVEVCLETSNLQVQIQVKDNGKGIKPEFLPYVFDTFRQADSSVTRSFGGLGLGLAIVRYLVELHGGTVIAESAGEDQGCCFTITLPRYLKTEPARREQPASSPIHSESLTLSDRQILIVDDDVDNLEMLQFILEKAGATVTAVTSARDALQKLSQSKPDLLIADIGMPQVDGYTLMRQIRSLLPDQGSTIPAIALTAYAGDYNRQQALTSGFQMHLAKPADPLELIEAIAHLLTN